MSSIQNAYQSLPARGAWIEIPWRVLSWDGGGSLPARGAWIEMTLTEKLLRMERSLPARGAWIEILRENEIPAFSGSRSPRGERGLKSLLIPHRS